LLYWKRPIWSSPKKQGREKLHYLNPVPIGDIYAPWISKFEQERIQALQNLKQALEEMG